MKIVYSKPTYRDLALAIMYVFKGYRMKYSGNIVTTEEEMDIEIMHFKFLMKYGLV